MKHKVLLNHDDFKSLLKGNVIKKNNIEIALTDIGYIDIINMIKEEYEKIR